MACWPCTCFFYSNGAESMPGSGVCVPNIHSTCYNQLMCLTWGHTPPRHVKPGRPTARPAVVMAWYMLPWRAPICTVAVMAARLTLTADREVRSMTRAPSALHKFSKLQGSDTTGEGKAGCVVG
jgi:hypothetical protein